jgi:hypothetical protein
METEPRRRIGPLGWSTIFALVAALPGVVIIAWSKMVRAENAVLVPWLDTVVSASMIAVAASPIVTVVLAIRAQREAPLGARFPLRLPLAQVAVAIGVLVAMVYADFEIFEAHYKDASVSAPDGQSTIYLYSSGELFSCGYKLYRQEGDSLVLHLETRIGVSCHDMPHNPRLARTDDGIKLLGDDGREVAGVASWRDLLPP